MEILFTVDDAYFEPFLVAALSLMSGTREAFRLHIISSLDDVRSARLRRFMHRLDIDFVIHTPADLLGRFGGDGIAASFLHDPHFYRLLMGRIVPGPRVLYLDCDILVRGDVAALWREDLRGAIAGAVIDPSFLPEAEAAFRAHHDDRYFNSGVMLVDLDRWRAERIEQAVAEAIVLFAERGNAGVWRSFWDQSPLNWALRGRWHCAHPAWNATPVTRPDQATAYGLDTASMTATLDDPRIYHFVGPFKPWRPEFASLHRCYPEHIALSRAVRGLLDR